MELIEMLRKNARNSPCKIIKFSATDGEGNFSYNGEFHSGCDGCTRKIIEQSYPNCKANHAEWGILFKNRNLKDLYIYCMTPDEKDFPFVRFWCKTCSILIPMFGVKKVFMWDGRKFVEHDPTKLIEE